VKRWLSLKPLKLKPEIETIEQLRELYHTPSERALRKQLRELDVHCQQFIALSPFMISGLER